MKNLQNEATDCINKLTITLTEEQNSFLKLFAAKQFNGSEENDCTSNAIHLVQESVSKSYQCDTGGIIDVIEWKIVAYFFIRDEAVRYIKDNIHKLEYPRIYTASAGTNNEGDSVHLRNLLLSMGELLLNKEGVQ